MLHLLSSLSVIFLKDLIHFVLFLLYAEILHPEYMNRVLVHLHVHVRVPVSLNRLLACSTALQARDACCSSML